MFQNPYNDNVIKNGKLYTKKDLATVDEENVCIVCNSRDI